MERKFKKIKVRFNLGKGKNYMKWKIEGPLGIEYHSPDEVQLIMKDCQLKNNRKTADKIFNGMNKDVCAWVLCNSISINYLDYHHYVPITAKDNKLKYNPRLNPFWDLNGTNVDGNKYELIMSMSKALHICA
jgi:hypothetical protein